MVMKESAFIERLTGEIGKVIVGQVDMVERFLQRISDGSVPAAAIARIWSGVVPQQPPTRLSHPSPANSRSVAAIAAGGADQAVLVLFGKPEDFDDVAAGYYEVEVRRGSDKFREEVWIYPYRTTFVEVTVQP